MRSTVKVGSLLNQQALVRGTLVDGWTTKLATSYWRPYTNQQTTTTNGKYVEYKTKKRSKTHTPNRREMCANEQIQTHTQTDTQTETHTHSTTTLSECNVTSERDQQLDLRFKGT